MPHYPEIDAAYDYLSKKFNNIGIAHIHLVEHSAMGASPVPLEISNLLEKILPTVLFFAEVTTMRKLKKLLKVAWQTLWHLEDHL